MISLEARTEQDYQQSLPERLDAEEFTNDQLLHLMMKCRGGVGPNAYLAPVYVRDIQRRTGETALHIVFTNSDLQPLPREHPAIVRDDMWLPNPSVNISWSPRLLFTIASEGYFLPYRNETIDGLLASVTEIYDLTSNDSLTNV